MIHAGRYFANVEGDFVVFLIGMRVNKLWAVRKWWPVANAMPRMIKELQAQPTLGLLGGDFWFGRTSISLQYWRSVEHLYAYAKDREAQHLPAWRDFNRLVGTGDEVGLWHETYLVSAGRFENIYVNMPAFGLGAVATLAPVAKGMQTAEARLRAAGVARTVRDPINDSE